MTDSQDNLIIFKNKDEHPPTLNSNDIIISQLFLLKQFSDFCFKYYFYNKIYFKIYFVKNKNYNVFLVYKYEKVTKICYPSHYGVLLYFKDFINYCKNELKIKINNIKYVSFPFEWEDALNNKNKTKNKDDDNRKIKTGQKGFGKVNQKKMLENELEEDDYYEEDEENEEDCYFDGD